MSKEINDRPQTTRENPADEEKTLFSIFGEFAEETTLHGIREIYKYWTVWPLRIFFILCQIGMWSVMSYHMFLVISQFVSEPVLVQIITTTQKTYKYPTLTFCPQLWLNVTRYHEMGIPKPAFLYAMSLMKRVVITERVDLEEAKNQLENFMNERNISSYYELYLLLGNDYTNESLFCEECSTWPPRKVVTEEGVCYHFKFSDWRGNYLADSPPRIAYNPVNYPNSSIYNSYTTIDISEYAAIGMHDEDFLALYPIFLLVNHSYFLRVTPTKHTMLNDKITACVEKPGTESALMCKAFCRQEIRDHTCDLPTVLGYVRGSNLIGPHWNGTPLFSSLNYSADNYYKMVRECNKQVQDRLDNCETEICPPWCKEMTFSTTVQTLQTGRILYDMPDAALAIIINYQVRAGVIQVYEVYSYTWYSFLSDVGGLIGLWCGASVVSVIPLATFFLDNCIFLSRRKWIRKKLEQRRKSFLNLWNVSATSQQEVIAGHMLSVRNGAQQERHNESSVH